ncbi:hypothetical protein WN55_01334 [Dufourea novaeangliae]|uniref:Uncharacterized protein n=1 Tax=Dufourea novaeangliae TaxID=178035 RepID=A0A154PFX6_DUFNO|nr:hypothetical protein WN55_01334 [Dufourea novaeangliae]
MREENVGDEKRVGRAQALVSMLHGDGQRAANVYNINANGLPYTLYTPSPIHPPLSFPLLRVSRHPSQPSAKYGIIFMDVFKLMHPRRPG